MSAVRAGHVLDGEAVVLGGVRIGGVGYVVGSRDKKGRRTEEAQLDRLASVLDADLLVLHEGPDENEAIEDTVSDIPLVVSGHRHHDVLRGSLVNVHERVLVLAR